MYKKIIQMGFKKSTGKKLIQFIITVDFRKELIFSKFTDEDKKVYNSEKKLSELNEAQILINGIVSKSKIKKENIILISCCFDFETDDKEEIKIFFLEDGKEKLKIL